MKRSYLFFENSSVGGFPGSPVVRAPCFYCCGAEGPVWSLVGELGPCKPRGEAKLKKKKKKDSSVVGDWLRGDQLGHCCNSPGEMRWGSEDGQWQCHLYKVQMWSFYSSAFNPFNGSPVSSGWGYKASLHLLSLRDYQIPSQKMPSQSKLFSIPAPTILQHTSMSVVFPVAGMFIPVSGTLTHSSGFGCSTTSCEAFADFYPPDRSWCFQMCTQTDLYKGFVTSFHNLVCLHLSLWLDVTFSEDKIIHALFISVLLGGHRIVSVKVLTRPPLQLPQVSFFFFNLRLSTFKF